MSSDKVYHIINLQTENVKRLKAVSITPNGRMVEISGLNGNGKSSVLDSIYYALGGKKDIPPRPIRDGENKAKTEVNIGGLVIRRTFNRQEDGTFTTTLVVENEEGARFQSPQNILDRLVGDLTFDPLEFTRRKPADQFEMMKKFVPGFDFEAAEGLRAKAFAARTETNRQIKELKSQIAGIFVPDDTPEEEIDVAALVAALQEVGEHNSDIEFRRSNRQKVSDEADRLEIEAAELEKRAQELLEQAEQKRGKATENRKRIEDAGPLPDPRSADDVRAKIDEANSINENVRARKRLDQLISQVNTAELKSVDLTKEIDSVTESKKSAIENATMPVEGLGFGDGFITLNGIPFDQASTSEQIRTSVAVGMAANPQLRIIMIREGSLLDENAMNVIAELAEKNDYQVWIECVGDGRPGAVIIEDGLVRDPNEGEVPE